MFEWILSILKNSYAFYHSMDVMEPRDEGKAITPMKNAAPAYPSGQEKTQEASV